MPGMFGVYVLERVFDMAATALLAVVALLLFEREGMIGSGNDLLLRVARSAGALLLVGLVGVVAFLIYFRYHGAAWLAKKLEQPKWRRGWREKIAVLLEGFSDGLRGVRTWSDLGGARRIYCGSLVVGGASYICGSRTPSAANSRVWVLRGPRWCWLLRWSVRRRSFRAAWEDRNSPLSLSSR